MTLHVCLQANDCRANLLDRCTGTPYRHCQRLSTESTNSRRDVFRAFMPTVRLHGHLMMRAAAATACITARRCACGCSGPTRDHAARPRRRAARRAPYGEQDAERHGEGRARAASADAADPRLTLRGAHRRRPRRGEEDERCRRGRLRQRHVRDALRARSPRPVAPAREARRQHQRPPQPEAGSGGAAGDPPAPHRPAPVPLAHPPGLSWCSRR